MKSRNLVLSEELWGRDWYQGLRKDHVVSARRVHTSSSWGLLLQLGQKDFELWYISWESCSDGLPMQRSSVRHTLPCAGLAFTISSSLTFQDVNSLHCQLLLSTPRSEFLFRIRKKGPVVELCYQIQRLIDVNNRSESAPAVVIILTFLWASEILWWLDIWK